MSRTDNDQTVDAGMLAAQQNSIEGDRMNTITRNENAEARRKAMTAIALALGGVAALSGGAHAQTAPEGYQVAGNVDHVTNVHVNADGSVELTLNNGNVVTFAADDVLVEDGVVYLSEAAIDAASLTATGTAAAAGGGGGAAIGALAGLGLAGAAAGGGGGGGGGGTTPPPPPANTNPPVFTSATTASVDENASGTVYTATATDADGNNISYSIVAGGDGALFSINSSTGALTFNAPPDFEAPGDGDTNNTYEVTIRASDGTNTTDQTVTITVNDVNEAPVFTSGTLFVVNENTTAALTAVATDPEGTVTYSLSGVDAALFSIDANTGEVTFIAPPNFEAPGSFDISNDYMITVTASDGTNSTSQDVIVRVADVNEFSPAFSSGTTANVAENQTTAYTAVATDGDTADLVTYSISGTDAALFDIDASTGVVTFKSAPDFEAPADAGGNNVYDIVVTASDGTNSTDQNVAITVTSVDEAPSFTSGTSFNAAENQTGAFTAAATDPEGAGVTYSLSGADAALFNIDPNTGVVTFIAAPDAEAPGDANTDNVYEVTVTATDGANPVNQNVSITVTDVNESAPVFTSGATASVPENQTSAYDADATDADATASITYSISGTDAALFNIDPNTGVVTFIAAPDFETPGDAGANNVYDIVVTASDGTNSTNQNVAITVTDAAESSGPTFTSGAAQTVSENQTSAYVATATPTTPGNTVTYTLSGTDAALFNIDATTGEVSFKAAPDFETPGDAGGDNVYDVTVSATDASGTSNQNVAITVGDAQDGGDVPNDNTTTIQMVSGGSYTGVLEANLDRDWVAIELEAGQTYVFTAQGSGGSPLNDTYLRLFNNAGALIKQNDDVATGIDTSSTMYFTPTTSGTYYVSVGAWEDNGGSTGQYTVDVGIDDAVWTFDEIAAYLDLNGFNSARWNASTGDTITVNITALTADGQTLARAALQLFSDITGITFQETGGSAQITFDDDEDGAFASVSTSGGFITSANVNVSTQWLTDNGTALDTYSFQTYIHEVGHALGLGHGGPYNATADYDQDSIYKNDSWQTTVMSYFDQNENTYTSANIAFVLSPQIADVLAMQNMYGLSTTTRVGDTTYGFNSTAGNAIYDATSFTRVTSYTIFDSGGTDTMDYSGSNANQIINLNPETFSSLQGGTGNVGIARGTIIENAIGGNGDDTLIGNSADNTLTGNNGNDSFYSSGGTDTFEGGAGTDTAYFSGSASDYTVTNVGGNTVVTDNRAGSPDGVTTLVSVENIVYDSTYVAPANFDTGMLPQDELVYYDWAHYNGLLADPDKDPMATQFLGGWDPRGFFNGEMMYAIGDARDYGGFASIGDSYAEVDLIPHSLGCACSGCHGKNGHDHGHDKHDHGPHTLPSFDPAKLALLTPIDGGAAKSDAPVMETPSFADASKMPEVQVADASHVMKPLPAQIDLALLSVDTGSDGFAVLTENEGAPPALLDASDVWMETPGTFELTPVVTDPAVFTALGDANGAVAGMKALPAEISIPTAEMPELSDETADFVSLETPEGW